jgi:hypothetical protein
LVSWWTGDSDKKDLYGVNNPSAVNGVKLVSAEVAKGFTFGSGGYIDIPHSTTLENQKFTWDAWVKPAGPGPNNDNDGSVILEQGIDNLHVSVALHWRASSDYRFLFIFGDVNSELIVSKDTFPPGAFYFVAGTYDGTTFRLYVNGVLEGTFTEAKTIPYSNETWEIGSTGPISRSAGYPRTFNGIIDEVDAFKSALSQSSIQAIYKRGSIGKCKAPVVFSPASLTFAEQNVGTTSPPKSITVVNNRNNAITMDGFSFTGTDPTDFAKSSTTCGSTLGSRKSCKVEVTFTQRAFGKLTAVLNVNDSALGSPQTAALSGGTGTAVELSPTSLGFACVVVGLPPLQPHCACNRQGTTTLTNAGSTPLDITSIATSSSAFSQTNTCNSSQPAGSSCAITVTWSPPATGCSAPWGCGGEVSISDNGGDSPQTVSLRAIKNCTPP